MMSARITPAVSLVVIGRNEGERLIRCLNSVHAVDYPRDRLEVIYVDTASIDGSADRAAALVDRVIRIAPERPSAAVARNAGWRVARHDLVQFLDGDTVLHRDWLRVAVSAIADANVACVFGRVDEADPQRGILPYWVHCDWYIKPGPSTVCGGVAMFRRPVLHRLAGYDDRLIAGEEPDLCFRIIRADEGMILSLDVPMITHDIGELTFRQYWRRSVRTGHAYAEVAARHVGSGHHFWLRQNIRIPVPFVALALAALMAVALKASWPLLVWVLLLCVHYGRCVLSEYRTTRSIKWSLLGAARHFACRTPQLLGQVLFVFRRLTGKGRGRLIEYKAPAAGADGCRHDEAHSER